MLITELQQHPDLLELYFCVEIPLQRVSTAVAAACSWPPTSVSGPHGLLLVLRHSVRHSTAGVLLRPQSF
jgi:hypothetical protein